VMASFPIDVPWPEPRRVWTKRGERLVASVFVDELEDPEAFWDLWRVEKGRLKARGFSVGKYKGRWELSKWSPVEVEHERPGDPPEGAPVGDDDDDDDLADAFGVIEESFLYPYQRPHARALVRALARYHAALDGSDTGTGKTFCTLFAAKALNLRVLVVCPKAVIPSWIRSIERVGVEPVAVVNYDLLRTGKVREQDGVYSKGKRAGLPRWRVVDAPYLTVRPNPSRGARYEPKVLVEWDLPPDVLVVFDEAHRCKNRDTLNTLLLSSLAGQLRAGRLTWVAMLSATIAEDPTKLFAPGMALGLFDEPWEFYKRFLPEHGCSKGAYGWECRSPRAAMEKLHGEIYGAGRGSRMRVVELIARGEFPESQVVFEAYEMDTAAEINAAYRDLPRALAELAERERQVVTPLAIRQKARQKVELLKVPTLVEMTRDLLAEGHSVVIFVNYTETLVQLCGALHTTCNIYGMNSAADNERNRLDFHENRERVIVCNLKAAREGIDLHDLSGEHPRVTLITPDDSAQNLRQALGRVWRAGGGRTQQRVVFAAGTVEEAVCENCRRKIANIDALNDGDLAVDWGGMAK